METIPKQKHIVLVHGACHGAWTWFKLKPRLESASHRVTAIDLSASGASKRKIEEISTFYDYTLPLIEFMEAIPAGEKVMLVGHSLGGLNLAIAMEMYPDKITVGVFLAAFMPDTSHAPSYILDKYNERTSPESWLDTQFLPYSGGTTMDFGPKFVASKLYNNSSTEDISVAMKLIRTGSLFSEDLAKVNKFSRERYGSVKRVYILCDQDLAIPIEFQLWMIQNIPVDEVKEINGADHMAMFSKPEELFHCLLNIANDSR